MKLLDVDGFAAVNAVMGMAKGRSCDVSGRLEAYSCKRVREDKKLARKIQDRSAPAEGRSPLIFAQEADPEDLADDCLGSFTMTPSMTDFGGSPSKDQLTSQQDTEAVVDLVSTLNLTFSDHTFTDIPASLFCREKSETVQRTIHTILTECSEYLSQVGAYDLEASIWKEIDSVVNLSHCEVFTFRPESGDSPVDGASWEYHYFFINRAAEVNKLVFFTVHGLPNNNDHEDMIMDDDLGANDNNYAMHYGATDTAVLPEDVDISSANSPNNTFSQMGMQTQ